MIGKKLQKALGLAVEELKRRRHEYLTLEHVLYGIASEPSGRKLIERCGGSAPVLRQALDHFFKTYMESLDEPTKDVYQTLAVQRVLDSALAHVKSAGRDEDIGVEVGDVLAAILEEEEYSWAAYCLKKQGITIVMVSHDVEFCARYADRVSMFFDGQILTTDTPRRFFGNNSFYTTAAHRMSRHVFDMAVTAEDVIDLYRQNKED